MKSTRWGPDEFIGWLRSGFAEYERKRHTLDEHVAFLPLRFNPESSALGQLLSFFNAASEHGTRLADHARIAVHDYLQDYAGIRMDEDERAFVINLWRVYPALSPGADMVILARKYITALDKSGETSARIGELVDVIIVAVASAPLNNTQISFFVDLVVKSKLWRSSYMLLVAGRFLDWAESPRQGWCELRMLLEDEIDAATDPTTASGRALIESIAERLISDQVPESLDVSGAGLLKDLIYGMDSPAHGPFISDAWPTPADIPPGLQRLLA